MVDETESGTEGFKGKSKGIPFSMGESLMENKETFRTTKQRLSHKNLTLLTKALDSTSDAIAISDTEGRHFYQNRAFSELFKFETAEELRAEGGAFAIIRDKNTAREIIDIAMSGESWAGELTMVKKSGRIFPAFVRVDAIKDDQGIIIGIIGVATDWTERKRTEKALHLNEARLETQFKLLQMTKSSLQTIADFTLEKAIELTDSKIGYLAFVNKDETLLSMYSWSKEAIKTCEIKEKQSVYPIKKTGLWGEAIRQRKPVITNNYSDQNPLKKGLPKGHVPMERHMNVPIFDGNRIVAVAGVGNKQIPYDDSDAHQLTLLMQGMWIIVRRQRAEEKLLESEKKYRNFFNNAQIGLWRTRLSDGLFLEANQRMVEMFGYDSRDELIGRISARDYYVEPETRSHMISELKEKGEIRNCETHYRRKDGSTLWARFSGTLFEKEGYWEGVTADITENKQAEAEKARLEEQYRQTRKLEAVGRLAGGVAHDMNNLLTPILGYSEMLMGQFGPDDRRKRSVDQILRAGYRSRDLVRQLLAFSRKQTLEYRPLNLNKAIEKFEKLLRRTIREDIEIEIIPAPGIGIVKADVGQIEQVVMNLSVNAQDAMSDGGRLTLKTTMVEIGEDDAAVHPGTQTGRYVMLSVNDTGGGMDEETLEHIFEPFFSTKGEEGTGLGLATVYGIIQQHNGNIRVHTEPGEGTTFEVYLPATEEVHVEKKGKEKSNEELHGSETILLVEDSRSVRELCHTALEQQGYTVLAAENGAEALARLISHDGPVHLLLTDVIMPGMNGKELFTKASEKRPDLRVLYMSGYTGNVISRHGVLDEGVQFIQKPFTFHGLATRVREVLAQD
ncbi:MAG: PAS domain S-box protein [Deltaproteobacteria bacterium]|nr:PAS domain S-box protein [Deltaproteobacteria bacterium]